MKKTEKAQTKNRESETIREEIEVIRYSPIEGEEFNDRFSFSEEIPKWFIEALEKEIQM